MGDEIKDGLENTIKREVWDAAFREAEAIVWSGVCGSITSKAWLNGWLASNGEPHHKLAFEASWKEMRDKAWEKTYGVKERDKGCKEV